MATAFSPQERERIRDSLLDAADGFAGWDDALVDDTLAQELEQ